MTPPSTALAMPSGRLAAIAAAAALEQCESLLKSISDSDHTCASDAMMRSTVGQHVRHALDHFAAALGGLDGLPIEYDHRERDTPVERDRAAAIAAVRGLRDRLQSLAAADADRSVRVRVMLNAEGDEAELGSTLGRELAFASHHAIHHHAMIAAIARDLGLAIPQGFGKAPSTLHHERSSRD